MKKGWEYIDFKDVYPIKMGKTPPRGDKSSWDEKKETHNKWVSIADISNNEGKIIDDTKEYISDSAAEKINKVSKGSLLMSFKLSIGRMAFAGDDLYTNEAIIAIPESNKYNLRFIYYYLLSYNWLSLTEGNEKVKGATLNKSSIGKIQLPVLPLSEQQSIVDYLDSAFAKIDVMKVNAEKRLNEAKSLFQASLKKMLEPKEGWDEKALGELSDKIGDGLHGTPKYTDDGEYFFVNGNNLENGVIEIKDNTKRVNHDEYEKFKLDLNSSTVLLSINGTIGKTAFYNGEPIILGKSACYINVLPALLKEYLRYYLVSDGFFNYVKSNSRQATITNLGLKEIRRMPIPTPSLDEQQSIVTTLDNIKSKVDRLQANYDKISQECDALKQAILRQVFE